MMKKEKAGDGKNNKIMLVIVFSLIFLIAGGVAGYFIGINHRNFSKNNFSENLSDSVKAEITAFFDSNPDTSAVTSYCQQNQMYCFYYCGQVNQDSEVCKQINLIPQGGMPSQKE